MDEHNTNKDSKMEAITAAQSMPTHRRRPFTPIQGGVFELKKNRRNQD